jgi:hypothetical protein
MQLHFDSRIRTIVLCFHCFFLSFCRMAELGSNHSMKLIPDTKQILLSVLYFANLPCWFASNLIYPMYELWYKVNFIFWCIFGLTTLYTKGTTFPSPKKNRWFWYIWMCWISAWCSHPPLIKTDSMTQCWLAISWWMNPILICTSLFIVRPIISLILFRKLQNMMNSVNTDKTALPHYLNGWLT